MSNTEVENLIDLSTEESEEINNENHVQLPTSLPLIAPPEGRLSLDNNPFDLVQKLATSRQDDPFEVVEKEASLKARQSFSKSTNDVKIGNLLSLSGDNDFLDSDSVQSSAFNNSTIYESAEGNDLENESPPITVSNKWTPESSTAESTGLSCDSSDSSSKQSNCIRNRKQRHYRNRLLKISLSNSTYSTPMSSRKLDENEMKQGNVMSMNNQHDELAAESPLKSMFEDVEESPAAYTEKDFDADLELMKIPMLNQINTPSHNVDEQPVSNELQKKDEAEDRVVPQNPMLPQIESIRLKLRAKKSEPRSKHDIQDLISNLKTMIGESNMVDDQKREQVNGLLETLSSTLNTAAPNTVEPVPQTITRQGTFSYDPPDKNEQQGYEQVNKDNLNEENGDLIGLTHQPMEEIPDIMVRSSATYDGETAEDKEYLNLPQIDPPSPPKEQILHPNLNDIMEQLQYLLEHHQLGASNQTEEIDSMQTNGLPSVASNPTFIVVMPTISHEESKDLCESNEISNVMRRRSQSLSIHDKLKIVQLPLKPSPDPNLTDTFESPPLSAANSSGVGTDGSDFKTPARFLLRRNSFSNTTPYTPMRCSRFGSSTLDKGHANGSESMTQSIASPARRRNLMDTHIESQYTQTLPRPQLGLMKPDPKKKVFKSTTQSIVKSNGPLKATLPVKKVAPNIKPNTSMHLVAKSGFISHTSTPMPDMRHGGLKVVGKTIPSACSTPTVSAPSPGKFSANAARYSNMSTTPIGKAPAIPTASAAGFRRRTISEFKPKSPIKTRSGVAIGVSSSSTLTKPSVTKSNLLRPSINSKTSTNTRSSVYGTSAYLATRNKENKQP